MRFLPLVFASLRRSPLRSLLTMAAIGLAVALALAIGLGGAFAPALRAARLRPIEALRKG